MKPARPQWTASEGWSRGVGETGRVWPPGTAGPPLAHSLDSQRREAAVTVAWPCCPLVFFHLCQGPQLVTEGVLVRIKSHHSECLLFASPCEIVYHLCCSSQPSKSTGVSFLELRKLRHGEAHAVTLPGSHSLFRDEARVGLCPVIGPRMQVAGQRPDGQAGGDAAAPTSRVGSTLAESGTPEPQLSRRPRGQALRPC